MGLRCVAGPAPRFNPTPPAADGFAETAGGRALWLSPRGVSSFWVELSGAHDERLERVAAQMMPVLASMLQGEWHRARLAEELAGRYEEIDLLYAITEILGRTVRLEEAAQTIVQEVSNVVGSGRASIMVLDEDGRRLRTVAARGYSPGEDFVVDVDDPNSVAARVYRERRVATSEAMDGADHADGRQYRGRAFLAVPICYGAPGTPVRCIGVINLTDRVGGDRFTPGDRKLLTAIAGQVGAAIENARLVAADRKQQQLRHELELAHDLQLKLLPSPAVLHGEAQVAARCVPADSVGGDFYTFGRLGGGRVGVMLGDVSSHGFGAALVMAHILSAAGIHGASASGPGEALAGLLDSVGSELHSTEMYFTVFHGVFDRAAHTLTWASAGHPYAFRVPQAGTPERLGATCPPLGLVGASEIAEQSVAWCDDDLLCLWTDGLVDARDDHGVAYGEARLLETLMRLRASPVERIVSEVLADADAWAAHPADDRTMLVLRL
ncbi:MAG TPA: SpoIIE family protein phosphatase [Gemmatimonadales bacterium]|nr:SpoIIE family protein phosphatase [Gemmatimonadales bacterium]